MRFTSDNAAAVDPAVMRAMAEADRADAGYDGDAWSRRLDGAVSDLFGTECVALWVTTGTAANGLALAALCPPHGGTICHRDAHVQNDECGAPEFFTAGAKLLLAEGAGAKLTPDAVTAVANAIADDVHRVQPHALSITNATEYGLSYLPAEVAALGDLCRARGWGFHMDGARFANAVAHAGCHPADVTWRAGVDVLSFGFVKNGGLSAELLVFFRPDLAGATRYRRKRAGHLLSKGRYLAAQALALLEGERWLANGHAANSAARELGAAAGGRLLYPVEANEVFLRADAAEATRLRDAGATFYDWAAGEIRLVTSWNQSGDEIERMAALLRAL